MAHASGCSSSLSGNVSLPLFSAEQHSIGAESEFSFQGIGHSRLTKSFLRPRSALRRLAGASSPDYKQPARTLDASPAYNPSSSTTSSTSAEEKPLTNPLAQDEIMPVLSGRNDSTSSSSTTTHRRPPAAVAAPPSYLPATVVRAMTDPARRDRYSIPFIWRNELARGGLMFLTRLLSYVLM